jgi:hypothetical protein
MIRGNIEVATPELIQGWIHLETGPVRDRTVLAVCDNECIGSGPVNVFREDLARAGLGDGYLGFTIPVSIAEDAVGSVVVKLDGSDAVLLQSGAYIANTGLAGRKLKRQTVAGRMASLKWALKHGRISQSDFDFQRVLWSLGAYERGLVHRNTGDDTPTLQDPNVACAALFESYAAQNVDVTMSKVRDPADFKLQLNLVAANPRLLPLVAVFTKDVATIRLIEGSHVSGSMLPLDSDGKPESASYDLSGENVLILESRINAELEFVDGVPVEVRMLSASTTI